MKGITYTQVAQFCVLIFAFMVPAIFIAILMTGTAIPQLGFGGDLQGALGDAITGGERISLLAKLDGLHEELGFAPYTSGAKSVIDVFCITMALMVGTAGLPHVIVRFYTVPRVRDARISAGWALLFIAILYTSAPAVAAFARTNLIAAVEGAPYAGATDGAEERAAVPAWFKNWEDTGLIAWVDKDGDGRIRYRSGSAFEGKLSYLTGPDDPAGRGPSGERLVSNTPSASENELYIDKDIMVLANPEIAALPDWVIALVAAGGLAAALSTAAGLLPRDLDGGQSRPAQADPGSRSPTAASSRGGDSRRPRRSWRPATSASTRRASSARSSHSRSDSRPPRSSPRSSWGSSGAG